MPASIHLKVNGQNYRFETAPEKTLVEALRDDFGLTGTKEACSVGVCGLCSVIVDGKLVSGCLTPVGLVDGCEITTIEGLAGDGILSPLQKSFIENGGYQCGICTPGQIVSGTALLREIPHPTDDEIKDWMMGNLCRCTGYYKILESIRAAAS